MERLSSTSSLLRGITWLESSLSHSLTRIECHRLERRDAIRSAWNCAVEGWRSPSRRCRRGLMCTGNSSDSLPCSPALSSERQSRHGKRSSREDGPELMNVGWKEEAVRGWKSAEWLASRLWSSSCRPKMWMTMGEGWRGSRRCRRSSEGKGRCDQSGWNSALTTLGLCPNPSPGCSAWNTANVSGGGKKKDCKVSKETRKPAEMGDSYMNKKVAHQDIHPNMSNYRFLGFRSYLLLFSESRYHLSWHTDRGRTQEFKVVFFFGWQAGSAFPLTLAQIIFRLSLQLAEVHVLL